MAGTEQSIPSPAAAGDETQVDASDVYTSKSGLKRKRKDPPSSTSSLSTAKKLNGEASFSLFDPLPPSPLVDSFQECLLSHFFPDGRFPTSAANSLPGPQPASLTRGDLVQLEKGQYWVCEKSDGERAILLLHNKSRKVVLVDRKWSCRAMRQECAEVLIDWLAKDGDTVIDAELLEVEKGEEEGKEKAEDKERRGVLYRVSMFDVIAVNGVRVADRMFGGVWSAANVSDGSGRMDALVDQIHTPYQSHVEEVRRTLPSPPPTPPSPSHLLILHFDLRRKNFESKHNIDRIVSRITHSPSSNPHFLSHLYRTSHSTNANDGLIFTPDRDTYHCRRTPLLKFKWQDLNTVDFLVEKPYRVEGKGLPLLCSGHVKGGGGGGGVVVREVVFDHIRRLDAVSVGWVEEVKARGVDSAIVECGYSRVDSDWHIKCVRWDKAKSNFLTTVVSTMKAVMDDLSVTDIEQACKKNKFQYRRSTDQ